MAVAALVSTGTQLVISLGEEVKACREGRKTAKEATIAVITRTAKAGIVGTLVSGGN